jgi:iron(III) transport system ATP-binding protein
VENSDAPVVLRVEGLNKWYNEGQANALHAVNDVSFEVRAGEFYTLLGPSGCGKTTTMRSVAGLDIPDGGRITINGEVVYEAGSKVFVAPHKRDVGMVFQSYAIWPHMTVFANTSFPLEVSKTKTSNAEVKERVEEALEAVELSGYESRMATDLSGGQQQRLALARALVRRPKLLLLDEPLSNLDAKLRDAMRDQLTSLQRRLGIATLYVTHDQSEALGMSTKIAVMYQGKVVQEDGPREIYEHPADRFVANFVGKTNFVPARVDAAGVDGRTMMRTAFGTLAIRCPADVGAGTDVVLSIRPEDVEIHVNPLDAENVFRGTVDRAVFLGESQDIWVRIGSDVIFARQYGRRAGRRIFCAGDEVFLEFPNSDCAILSEGGNLSRPSEEPSLSVA